MFLARPTILGSLSILLPSLASAWTANAPPGFWGPAYGVYGWGYPPGYGAPIPDRGPRIWGPNDYPLPGTWQYPAPSPWESAPPQAPASAGASTPDKAPGSAAPSAPASQAGAQRHSKEPGPETLPPRKSGYGPDSATPFPFAAPLRIFRNATADAYEIRVTTGNGKTAEIQATPRDRGIAIARTTDAGNLEEQTFDEGRGFRRSYSFSRGAASRFVALPRDADLARMTREESDGTLILRVPRIPPARGGATDPARRGAPEQVPRAGH